MHTTQREYQLLTWAGPLVLTGIDNRTQSQAELPVINQSINQ